MFVCVHCNCRKKSKMRLNENMKKGCEEIVDDDETQLTPKFYLPLRNAADKIILAIGENVLEYHVKL